MGVFQAAKAGDEVRHAPVLLEVDEVEAGSFLASSS